MGGASAVSGTWQCRGSYGGIPLVALRLLFHVGFLPSFRRCASCFFCYQYVLLITCCYILCLLVFGYSHFFSPRWPPPPPPSVFSGVGARVFQTCDGADQDDRLEGRESAVRRGPGATGAGAACAGRTIRPPASLFRKHLARRERSHGEETYKRGVGRGLEN